MHNTPKHAEAGIFQKYIFGVLNARRYTRQTTAVIYYIMDGVVLLEWACAGAAKAHKELHAFGSCQRIVFGRRLCHIGKQFNQSVGWLHI